MKFLNRNYVAVISVLGGAMLPSACWGCACGCGVFDVGGSSMFPSGTGGMAFVQYDYQDQDRNWNGTSQTPSENNPDKQIQTHFVTTGVQYMFNRSWGFSAELPYAYRSFKTTSSAPGNPITTINWAAPGDMRVQALYTGFRPDMSIGLDFGLKLPTGDFTHQNEWQDVDRDSQIGTGSTDLLLGGFYRGNLTSDARWDWYAQTELDAPFLQQDNYLPGVEVDTAAGIDYKGWVLGRTHVSPLAQVIFSERTSDSGANAASPVASGYQRLMLSPGIEFHIHPVTIYADVEVPVWQNFTGDQLAADILYKLSVSVHF